MNAEQMRTQGETQVWVQLNELAWDSSDRDLQWCGVEFLAEIITLFSFIKHVNHFQGSLIRHTDIYSVCIMNQKPHDAFEICLMSQLYMQTTSRADKVMGVRYILWCIQHIRGVRYILWCILAKDQLIDLSIRAGLTRTFRLSVLFITTSTCFGVILQEVTLFKQGFCSGILDQNVESKC